MKLYHGTDAKLLPRILQKGLIPRGSKGGNWQRTVTSNAAAVYMTDTYALYFAFNATRYDDGAHWMMVEIDIDRLDHVYLLPDEDFLEQVGRLQKDKEERGAPKALHGGMKERTLWYRNNLYRWMDGEMWKLSLQHLGTCQYAKPVPVRALTRVCIVPAKRNLHIPLVVDPLISLMNYRLCAGKYRTITAKLMGDDPGPGWQKDIFAHTTTFRCEGIRILTLDNGKVTGERVFDHDDTALRDELLTT